VSDPYLAPLTALGDNEPVTETISGITIHENPGFAIASVAARMKQVMELNTKLEVVLGGPLPDPGKAVIEDGYTAVWTGVEQWFFLAPYSDHPDFAAEIKAIVADSASVTEQTDGWVIFEVTGDNLVSLLERICNLNAKAMVTGDATRCLIEHLGCLIICHESGRNISVLGPRSSANSLHHSLVTAARSIA
jgi:sarcosine oxidase subunit gamma